MRTSNSLAVSLYGVKVGPGQGLGWRSGFLRRFAHPFGCDVCWGHAQRPAFAPGASEVEVGLFGLFVSYCS